MRQSFYHFMMTYRGKLKPDKESELAEWMFRDHEFPRQAEEYDELSYYLEMNAPFVGALSVFDELYNVYCLENK